MITNSNSPENDNVKAWGGDTVLSIQKSKDDTYKYKLIEATNVDVLKFVYGDNNVSGTLSTGITIQANSDEAEYRSVVIDMIMKGGIAKRVVLPSCKVTEIGDIVYNDSEPVGYDVTVTCVPDASGNTHYEYIK